MHHLTEHDAQQIAIFKLELDLVAKLEHAGHTSQCAIWLVVGEIEGGASECTCSLNRLADG